MKVASDYLHYIKAIVLASSCVSNIEIVREEAIEEMGLYRFRLRLLDDSLLELFERFSVQAGSVNISKYSFHWQNDDGQLRKRWDNAVHFPEISTHPHHIHVGSDKNVLPSTPMNAVKVLEFIAKEMRV